MLAIDVHRECYNCVVTLWVISQLFHFLGASRGCADFRDPTAVFRLNAPQSKTPHHSSAMPRSFLNRSIQIYPKYGHEFAQVIFSQALRLNILIDLLGLAFFEISHIVNQCIHTSFRHRIINTRPHTPNRTMPFQCC